MLSTYDMNPGSKFESTTTKCSFKIGGQEVVAGYQEASGTLYKANFVAEKTVASANLNAVTTNKSVLHLYYEYWGH